MAPSSVIILTLTCFAAATGPGLASPLPPFVAELVEPQATCESCPACPPSKWPCKDVCCDPTKGEMCPGAKGGPATPCCKCGDPSCLCNGAVAPPLPPPPPVTARYSCQPGNPPCQQSATGTYTDPNCGGKCGGPPGPPPPPPTPTPPSPPPAPTPTPPAPPPPPGPTAQCDPNARPKEFCPGGIPCPQCGKPACPCPP